MDNVTDMIEEARRLIGEGKDKRAAELLTAAIAECDDPGKAAQINALAAQGRDRAGRFGKRRWEEPIRMSEAVAARGRSGVAQA